MLQKGRESVKWGKRERVVRGMEKEVTKNKYSYKK
jgi:hypothetical protein